MNEDVKPQQLNELPNIVQCGHGRQRQVCPTPKSTFHLLRFSKVQPAKLYELILLSTSMWWCVFDLIYFVLLL